MALFERFGIPAKQAGLGLAAIAPIGVFMPGASPVQPGFLFIRQELTHFRLLEPGRYDERKVLRSDVLVTFGCLPGHSAPVHALFDGAPDTTLQDRAPDPSDFMSAVRLRCLRGSFYAHSGYHALAG